MRTINFNPRPPRGGRRCSKQDILRNASQFQSTPSAGRATSILPRLFYRLTLFQSTPSAGRATIFISIQPHEITISIHALRGEGDGHTLLSLLPSIAISIHALRGEGDLPIGQPTQPTRISIHALRGEGDVHHCSHSISSTAISIHALRGEGDVLACTVPSFII